MTRTVTASDGTRLAVHVVGDGPPLLCIPGGPGRASAYLEDLGGLAASHTLHLLDMRGTGMSDLPADRSSLAFPRLADDVEEVRQALELDRPDVLGHSAGCHVAMVHALRRPKAIRRLVLVTPSATGLADVGDDIARIRQSRQGEHWYADVAALERELASLPDERRQRVDRGLRPYYYGRWDDRAQQHAASTDTQMSLRATAAFIPEDGAGIPAPAELAAVDVPVLVVVGDRDGLTGTAAGDVVAGALKQATVATIAGAGHYPWVDEPTDFAAPVTEFLEPRP